MSAVTEADIYKRPLDKTTGLPTAPEGLIWYVSTGVIANNVTLRKVEDDRTFIQKMVDFFAHEPYTGRVLTIPVVIADLGLIDGGMYHPARVATPKEQLIYAANRVLDHLEDAEKQAKEQEERSALAGYYPPNTIG